MQWSVLGGSQNAQKPSPEMALSMFPNVNSVTKIFRPNSTLRCIIGVKHFIGNSSKEWNKISLSFICCHHPLIQCQSKLSLPSQEIMFLSLSQINFTWAIAFDCDKYSLWFSKRRALPLFTSCLSLKCDSGMFLLKEPWGGSTASITENGLFAYRDYSTFHKAAAWGTLYSSC